MTMALVEGEVLMRGRVGALGVGVCLLLTGCVPSQDMQQLVSNPFGLSPDTQLNTSMYPPSEQQELAKRVLCIGEQVVRANADLNLHPLFPVICSEQAE